MGRVNDDKWLEQGLENAIHSDDTQPDFEQWKADHPEAVDMLTSRTPYTRRTPMTRRIKMNTLLVKLAAAAAIVIAATFGIYKSVQSGTQKPDGPGPVVATVLGPTSYSCGDGSVVRLGPGAQIRTYGQAGRRGFEHLAGPIDVTVAKGKGEFVVTTVYGQVKALGTQFRLELVDGVAQNTKEKVQLLAVEVEEGKVEVSNSRGSSTLTASQRLIVESDQRPYDFSQDAALPEGLNRRINAMVEAFGKGDPSAYASNYNFDYVFKLAKGQVPYDPQRFGGTEEDAKRLQEMAAGINSPGELAKAFLGSVNIKEPTTVYVRSVELNEAGDHAKAVCIQRKTANHMVITGPQWHFFDNDWWQVDD